MDFIPLPFEQPSTTTNGNFIIKDIRAMLDILETPLPPIDDEQEQLIEQMDNTDQQTIQDFTEQEPNDVIPVPDSPAGPIPISPTDKQFLHLIGATHYNTIPLDDISDETSTHLGITKVCECPTTKNELCTQCNAYIQHNNLDAHMADFIHFHFASTVHTTF